MEPTVQLSKLQFSDNTSIDLSRGDIVVLVGPNNSGKSEALRAIYKELRGSHNTSPVLKDVKFSKGGTYKDVISWLEKKTNCVATYLGDHFQIFGKQIARSSVRMYWEDTDGIGQLADFFCRILGAEDRLGASNAPKNIPIINEPPRHPIHTLQWDDSEESRISEYFENAFGVGITVHRNAGEKVPILIGRPPTPELGKDRLSIEYLKELEKLPRIEAQGDGMRSFLGVLLFAAIGFEPILLIDEPEAFLHPPQARHLGRFLVKETSPNRQLILATHSGDILRGAIDAESARVRVIRIRREQDRNIAHQLESRQISEIWSDPLLRYSNALDALFHDHAVVCESDSDCRFYSAILDSILDSSSRNDRKPDIMFTHCGGKARMPLIIRSLRALGVPLSVIADFDVLNAESPLRDIVDAAGGDWASLKGDWKKLKNAIEEKKPQLSVGEVHSKIDGTFRSLKGHIITDEAKKQIQEALRASSPWATAKSVGVAFIPNGDPHQAAHRLLSSLEQLGIFVVPVGELEGFLRSEGSHGPGWVANALRRDLRNDPELEPAKDFVRKVTVKDCHLSACPAPEIGETTQPRYWHPAAPCLL